MKHVDLCTNHKWFWLHICFTQKIKLCMRQQFRVHFKKCHWIQPGQNNWLVLSKGHPVRGWCLWTWVQRGKTGRSTMSTKQYVAKVKNSKRQAQPGKQCRQETSKIQKVTEYQTSHTQEPNGEQNAWTQGRQFDVEKGNDRVQIHWGTRHRWKTLRRRQQSQWREKEAKVTATQQNTDYKMKQEMHTK